MHRLAAFHLEVARWAGHSPKVMFDHYANVIDELVGKPRVPVDKEISDARKRVATMRKEALDELQAMLLDIERFANRHLGPGEDDWDEPAPAEAT